MPLTFALPRFTVVNPQINLHHVNSGGRAVHATRTGTGAPEVSHTLTSLQGVVKSLICLQTRFERGGLRRISRRCNNPCAGDYAISPNNLVLTSNFGGVTDQVTVSTALNVGKPSGKLIFRDDNNFTPVYNRIDATSQTLIYDFRNNISAAISMIPSRQAQVKRGVVQSLLITSKPGKFATCATKTNNPFQALCSGGFSPNADRRTHTATNFKAGLNLNASAVMAFNGTLTSTGQWPGEG